jgi:hypothetical protein
MKLFINELGNVLFLASLVAIFILSFRVSTNLSLKKLIIGGAIFIVFGVSMMLMNIGERFALNKNFFLLVFCMGSLGVAFVFGRWVSNRSNARLQKYIRKKYHPQKSDDIVD